MKRMLALATAAALSVVLQGQAPTTTPPPVNVDYCAFNPWSFTSATASIVVHFHVTGAVAADQVEFYIRWGDGSVSEARDAGQFTPDAAINHYLNFPIMLPVTGETYESVYLAVGDVHLSDGSSFDEPFRGVVPVRCEIIRGAGASM